ncbi:MAG: hypothetical protein H6747_07855 [Deltaproteobacteria bacterium]|nr:hypothetical protein [Deltaproteobacteria bacterium]
MLRVSLFFAALALVTAPAVASAGASAPCTPADRLPACKDEPRKCLAALKASPKGEPATLACTAEAACVAGKAAACPLLAKFVRDGGIERDLLANLEALEQACAANKRGPCAAVPAMLEAKRKTAPASQHADLGRRIVSAQIKACEQGLGCDELVAALAGGKLDGHGQERAATALEAVCKGNAEPAACGWMSKTYGDLKDPEARKASCNKGVARACAVQADEDKLAGKDPDPSWKAACEAGDCASCQQRIRDDRGKLRVAVGHDNAKAALSQCSASCKARGGSACDQAMVLRLAGVGTARDEAGVVSAQLAACKLDAAACPLLARAWIVTADADVDGAVATRLGEVCKTERDAALREPACAAPAARGAVRAGRAACAGGDKGQCTTLGRKLRDLGLHAQAAEVLDGACTAGHGAACATLVDLRSRAIDLPPLDTAAAARLSAAAGKACKAGDHVACFEWSQAEAQNSPAAKAASKALQAACKKGDGAACRMAADLCEGYGRKLRDDPKRALALRESGCKAGDMASCVAAGKQLDQEAEGPDGSERSGALFQTACKAGNAEGCTRLRTATPQPEGAAATLSAACKAGVLDVCK